MLPLRSAGLPEEETYYDVFNYHDERFNLAYNNSEDENIETSVDSNGYVYKDGYRLGKGDGASLPAGAIVGAQSSVNIYQSFSRDTAADETEVETAETERETVRETQPPRETVRYTEAATTEATTTEAETTVDPETPAAPELVGY